MNHTVTVVDNEQYLIDMGLPYRMICSCMGQYGGENCETKEKAVKRGADHLASAKRNTARIALEKKIVRGLIRHLKTRGWNVFCTHDGEDWEYPTSENETLALVFNLDEVSLRFIPAALGTKPDASKLHDSELRAAWKRAGHAQSRNVLLVLGNGCDVIADYTYKPSQGDEKGWCKDIDSYSDAHSESWEEEYFSINRS